MFEYIHSMHMIVLIAVCVCIGCMLYYLLLYLRISRRVQQSRPLKKSSTLTIVSDGKMGRVGGKPPSSTHASLVEKDEEKEVVPSPVYPNVISEDTHRCTDTKLVSKPCISAVSSVLADIPDAMSTKITRVTMTTDGLSGLGKVESSETGRNAVATDHCPSHSMGPYETHVDMYHDNSFNNIVLPSSAKPPSSSPSEHLVTDFTSTASLFLTSKGFRMYATEKSGNPILSSGSISSTNPFVTT